MRCWILEVFFLALVAALTVAFFRVVAPFLLDLFFAMLFVSLSWPLLRFYRQRLCLSPGWAAFGATASDLLAVALPAAALAAVFSVNAVGGLRALVSSWPGRISEVTPERAIAWVEGLPLVGSLAKLASADLTQLVREAVDFASRVAGRLARQSVTGLSTLLFHLFITVLLMYSLFRDGESLPGRIRTLLPFSDEEAGELLSELRGTAAATLVSTLLVGLMEGLLGGLLFLVFGLPSPLLFALLMMVISMVPLVGTNLVLVPAGAVLILQGRVAAGIVIITAGVAGVAVTQNVIKPRLLGGRTGLHPALALLSILGGIAWLGVAGFVIGPLVVALTLVIWAQFGKRYRTALDARNRT